MYLYTMIKEFIITDANYVLVNNDKYKSLNMLLKSHFNVKMVCFYTKWYCNISEVKPLSHQTALPQRLHNVLKQCQRAVGSPRNTRKNIKFVCYSVYTTSSQRPYSVHTTFPQRLYSVHDVFTARKQLLQRVHSAHTVRTQRSHGAHTASSRRL